MAHVHKLVSQCSMWVSIPYAAYESLAEYEAIRNRMANILNQATGIHVTSKIGYSKCFMMPYDAYKEGHIDRIITNDAPAVLVLWVKDGDLDKLIESNSPLTIGRGQYNEVDYAVDNGIPIMLMSVTGEGSIYLSDVWDFGTDYIHPDDFGDAKYFRYRMGYDIWHGDNELNPGAIDFYSKRTDEIRKSVTEMLEENGTETFYNLVEESEMKPYEITANNVALGIEQDPGIIAKSISNSLRDAADNFEKVSEDLRKHPLAPDDAYVPRRIRIVSWHW